MLQITYHTFLINQWLLCEIALFPAELERFFAKSGGWGSPGSFEIISEFRGNQRLFKHCSLRVLSIGDFASFPSYCNQEQLCPAKALNSVGNSEPDWSPAHCTIGQSSFEMNESHWAVILLWNMHHHRQWAFLLLCSTSVQHFNISPSPQRLEIFSKQSLWPNSAEASCYSLFVWNQGCLWPLFFLLSDPSRHISL